MSSTNRTSQPASAYANTTPISSNDFRRYSQNKSASTSQLPVDTLTNRHLHAELKRIDDLINDVEMQGPLSEELAFIVLDTNIVLHHLEVIDHFITDIEKLSLHVMVIIPGVVINELDGQKNRDGLAWFARRASAWLLRKVKERKSVKGQALDETCKNSKNWKTKESGQGLGTERANDGLILDCCKYFLQIRKQRTFLCSADKNLCFEAESESIHTILPSRSRYWCAQDVAQVVFGPDVDLSNFASHNPSYRLSSIIDSRTAQPHFTAEADDCMDVDDDSPSSGAEVLLPSHALDLLHIQVIEHFTRLLVELVGQVAGDDLQQKPIEGGTNLSRYALQHPQTHHSEWDAPQCIEYLHSKRPAPQCGSLRAGVFLAQPYTRRGARRGQDWSRRDWEVALDALANIGDLWQEGFIRECRNGLKPIMEDVFGMRMRPTGI